MTEAERALLLAVAKRLTTPLNKFKGQTYIDLVETIIAVEAEAAPEAPSKSCVTCSSYLVMYDKCLYPRDGECLPTHKYWQPKPTEDVCPSCEGTGMTMFNACQDMCWTCDGTGKKEKK